MTLRPGFAVIHDHEVFRGRKGRTTLAVYERLARWALTDAKKATTTRPVGHVVAGERRLVETLGDITEQTVRTHLRRLQSAEVIVKWRQPVHGQVHQREDGTWSGLVTEYLVVPFASAENVAVASVRAAGWSKDKADRVSARTARDKARGDRPADWRERGSDGRFQPTRPAATADQRGDTAAGNPHRSTSRHVHTVNGTSVHTEDGTTVAAENGTSVHTEDGTSTYETLAVETLAVETSGVRDPGKNTTGATPAGIAPPRGPEIARPANHVAYRALLRRERRQGDGKQGDGKLPDLTVGERAGMAKAIEWLHGDDISAINEVVDSYEASVLEAENDARGFPVNYHAVMQEVLDLSPTEYSDAADHNKRFA